MPVQGCCINSASERHSRGFCSLVCRSAVAGICTSRGVKTCCKLSISLRSGLCYAVRCCAVLRCMLVIVVVSVAGAGDSSRTKYKVSHVTVVQSETTTSPCDCCAAPTVPTAHSIASVLAALSLSPVGACAGVCAPPNGGTTCRLLHRYYRRCVLCVVVLWCSGVVV